MKLLLTVLFIICTVMPAFSYDFYCPNENKIADIKNENIINKLTGINFASEKIAEIIIENELRKSLNSKIYADLDIYSIGSMNKGEFKSLKLRSNRIQYKAFSISDFEAKTRCGYNKIIYKNKRIYYPDEMFFDYKAAITNEDIKHILNSNEFQKKLNKFPLNIKGNSVLKIRTPEIEIKNGKIYYTIPVETLLVNFVINFNSELTINNNTINLTNISPNSIFSSITNSLTDKINPFKYEMGTLNGKYCKINITKVKISDNIINTEGIFIINKNYTENNE